MLTIKMTKLPITHFIAALTIIKKLPTRTEILKLLVTAIIQGTKKGNITKLPEK